MTTNETIADVLGKLDGGAGEVILDLSSVRRIDARELRAFQNLAAQAAAKSVKLTLRGVNVDIYKVLKLA
jgi:anti-anti-sigma regulatory factor